MLSVTAFILIDDLSLDVGILGFLVEADCQFNVTYLKGCDVFMQILITAVRRIEESGSLLAKKKKSDFIFWDCWSF